MPPLNLTSMKDVICGMQQSSRLAKLLAWMDEAITFMTRRNYVSDNPALDVARFPLVVGYWSMLVLVIVILMWGALSPLESAVMASGKVVLLSSKKTVQHLEGGIIKEILVKDGDVVKEGQPLLRLSDTSAVANRNVLQTQLYVARGTLARLIAERDKQSTITFDEDMVAAGQTNAEVAHVMEAQTSLFVSESKTNRAKQAVFDQRIAQSQEEINGLTAQKESASGQGQLINQEIETFKELLAKGLAIKSRLYELQRTQSEINGNHGQYEAQIAKARENMTETRMQMLTTENEFNTKNAQDLRDAQGEVANLQDKLRSASDIAARTTVIAPTGGIITASHFHTDGGVIEPGAPILDIIPQDDTLIVEAHVRPNDISSIHVGLESRLIFPSYKMRTTPKVPGKLVQVSADSITDEHTTPPSSYYLVQVEADKEFMHRMKQQIELYPGMPVEVMLRTGSRTFLDYLFKPFSDSTQRAFREQ